MNANPLNNRLPDWLASKLLNPIMPGIDSERQDDQLLQMLDEPRLWLVRGGHAGVLGGPNDSLHAALNQALRFYLEGEAPAQS